MSPVEVIITIVLFTLIYLFIFVAYVRIVAHFIKKGPDDGLQAVSSSEGGVQVASEPAAVAAADAVKEGE